jgi:hypothetical protein
MPRRMRSRVIWAKNRSTVLSEAPEVGRSTGDGANATLASVPFLTDDSQIGAHVRFFADEEDRADFDQRS